MTKPTAYPSLISIKKWAYQKSKLSSHPDWQEAITTFENAELLILLASDQNCPRRAFILNCLYVLVGKSVSKHDQTDISKIHMLLDSVKYSSDNIILNWVRRSRLIIGDLRKYDYVEWCQGGFAKQDIPTA